MQLNEIVVRPILPKEELEYQALMNKHHYLGSLVKIGETLRYIALWRGHWVALLSFSSPALKCSDRDRWIGWSYRHQFDRLNLLTNNSRFLILPQWHYPNLASRVLSLCQRRLAQDWVDHFQHPLLLLETFVDPQRFHGTIYKAANWHLVGSTKGYSRSRGLDYQANASSKLIYTYELQRNGRSLLARTHLPERYHCGARRLMLTADQMNSLPDFFRSLPDPRRAQGRRHRLSTVLSIATAAILCGRVGYKGIAQWADSLGQKARARFNCRYENGQYLVPSESAMRSVLIRVDPEALDKVLLQWSMLHAKEDESLAIDGKTMRSAIDRDGKQTHIMGAVGHQSLTCYTQKKSVCA